MPPLAYLLAKLTTAMAFALMIYTILLGIACTLGHVTITPGQVLQLGVVVLCGVIPFAAMGLMLAMVMPPNAAASVINLVYQPMSFLGGLYMPLFMLPVWIQKLAPALPTFHLAQIALEALGLHHDGPLGTHIAYLAVYSVGMLTLAAVLFRRSAARG